MLEDQVEQLMAKLEKILSINPLFEHDKEILKLIQKLSKTKKSGAIIPLAPLVPFSSYHEKYVVLPDKIEKINSDNTNLNVGDNTNLNVGDNNYIDMTKEFAKTMKNLVYLKNTLESSVNPTK